MQTSNLEENRGKIKHCLPLPTLPMQVKKEFVENMPKEDNLLRLQTQTASPPPQFAGLETFSQVLVFFLQCRHKKRLLAGENGAGSERNGSIHLLSWSFTVQSYLSGKLQTPSQRTPRWGVELLCTVKKILVIYMLSKLLMGLNLANPDCLVGREGANRPPMPGVFN